MCMFHSVSTLLTTNVCVCAQVIDSANLLALPESELLLGNFKYKEKSPRYTLMVERFNRVRVPSPTYSCQLTETANAAEPVGGE